MIRQANNLNLFIVSSLVGGGGGGDSVRFASGAISELQKRVRLALASASFKTEDMELNSKFHAPPSVDSCPFCGDLSSVPREHRQKGTHQDAQ